MTQQQVKALLTEYPALDAWKFNNALPMLERMRLFYEEKSPIAPGNQKIMFMNFAAALGFAEETIKQHNELTKELAALKGAEDENRTNSAK